MRLFHVSEESSIEEFVPRSPDRNDLDKSKKLVWAITEQCLPNFLTPRDCPRVAYYADGQTTREDMQRFFSSDSRHCIAIEHGWYKRMSEAVLYLYEFDISNFYLQDKCAGYYVSEETEKPISKIRIRDLFGELIKRNIEILILDNCGR